MKRKKWPLLIKVGIGALILHVLKTRLFAITLAPVAESMQPVGPGMSGLGADAAQFGSKGLDLSREQDLSIALMNLISLEEHAFFSFNRTGDTRFLSMLDQFRTMRRDLMKQIVPSGLKGEVWCMAKHLLAATMRLFEVGNKLRTEGRYDEAEQMFRQAYALYNQFFELIHS